MSSDAVGEDTDRRWMERALALAERAREAGEVPVGAVVVADGVEIGAGWNRPIGTRDPTAHAEVVALRAAAVAAGNYRLPGTVLYVTLEPCAMCVGAIVQARVARVVFAADDPRAGAAGSAFDLLGAAAFNHRPDWTGGVLAAEAGACLRSFFAARRGGDIPGPVTREGSPTPDLLGLAARAGEALGRRGLRLATAESCTGGWIGAVLTAVPGSSAWYERGFVTYSNTAKREDLGVRPETLDTHGSVSPETAGEMAAGALARSGADVAVAVTGVAGPGGGTPAKPVGTVCLAWAARDGERRGRRVRFAGDREAIRRQSVAAALEGVLDLAGGAPPGPGDG